MTQCSLSSLTVPELKGRWTTQGGYNLVVLMVMVTVLNVVIATALPAWSHLVKREKEEELIFRGMQYAEAIRVYQQRHGGLPLKLEDLLEVEPRSIRQLYPDPMSEHGNWGLLIQASQPARPATAQRGQQSDEGQRGARSENQLPRGIGAPGQRDDVAARQQRGSRNMVAVPPSTEEEEFGRPTQRTTGPIVGVYSATDEQSLRKFLDRENYSEWQFHIGLIPTPVMLGGDSPTPRVHSGWVGKPFRDDLKVQKPGQGNPNQGQDLTGGDRENSEPLRPSRFRPRKNRR